MGWTKLRMHFLNFVRLSPPKVPHNFNFIKLIHSDKTSNKDLFDILEEKIEEDIGYDQWLASTKKALSNSKGRFWIGKNSPFPYNPGFSPKPVISDASKTKIFEVYKQNSKLNDQRALAVQFKVSIERIGAIIRQKELELELAKQGEIVNKDFVSSMESNLECIETSEESFTIKDQIRKLPFRPTFACVPEGRAFNFQDAKNVIISKGINVKSSTALNENINVVKQMENTSLIAEKISESIFEKSRSKYIFVNLNKESSSEKRIVVRDFDGSLRTATREELEYVSAKTWNRNRPQI